MVDATQEMSEALAHCLATVCKRGPDDEDVRRLADALARADTAALSELRERVPGATEQTFVLLGYDLPGIQGAIHDTSRRPIIHATSRLIQEACRDVVRYFEEATGLPRSCVVFSGGGQGLIVVPRAAANTAESAVRRAFQRVQVAQPVVARLDIRPVELVIPDWGGPELGPVRQMLGLDPSMPAFALLRARLARRIQEQRRVRGSEPMPGDTVRCGACHVRPAGQEQTRDGLLLCDVCRDRQHYWAEHVRSRDEQEVLDFSNIARPDPGAKGRVRRENHVAVVYADGNNVGGVLDHLASIAEYRAFSRALDAVVQQGRRAVLEQMGIEKRVTLLAGGDDLLVLLPGPVAMGFVVAVCNAVEEMFTPDGAVPSGADLDEVRDDLWRTIGPESSARDRVGRVGLSVGVVFAEPSFPLRLMVRYGKEVLGEAKKRAHQTGERSLIDFICVGTGAHIGTAVAEDRSRRLDRDGLRLTERPYSMPELQTVLREVTALQKLPRSQIYGARRMLLDEPSLGRLNLEYQVARSREWQTFCEDLAALHSEKTPFTPGRAPSNGNWLLRAVELASWRRRRGKDTGLATPILDWMELMDHVHVQSVQHHRGGRS